MIRKATLEDIDLLAKLFNSYRIFYKQESNLDEAKLFLRTRLELSEATIFLKIADNEVVAFAQLYPSFSSISMKPVWILNDLFVCENNRGEGYAKELLNMIKNTGKELGLKYLSLKTAKDNFAAQKLYKSDGWIIEDDYISFNFHY